MLERLKEVAERSLQHEAARDAEGNIVGDYSFAHAGANRVLELLGKHLGMFRDRVDLGRPGGGPIETDNTFQVEFVRAKGPTS